MQHRPFCLLANYACCGAPTGQTSAQAPQSIHVSASITYLPSPSEIAPTGHSPAQAPQLMHSSEILYAIINTSERLIEQITLLSINILSYF